MQARGFQTLHGQPLGHRILYWYSPIFDLSNLYRDDTQVLDQINSIFLDQKIRAKITLMNPISIDYPNWLDEMKINVNEFVVTVPVNQEIDRIIDQLTDRLLTLTMMSSNSKDQINLYLSPNLFEMWKSGLRSNLEVISYFRSKNINISDHYPDLDITNSFIAIIKKGEKIGQVIEILTGIENSQNLPGFQLVKIEYQGNSDVLLYLSPILENLKFYN